MASLLDLTRNYSFYAIPAAWVVALGPHIYATALYDSKSAQKFDNKKPRGLVAQCEADQSIDANTRARVVRAEAAQQNGMENVGLFAAAVVAGNIAGLDNQLLNGLSGGYVASRVVYNYLYINNSTDGLAMGRTGIFLAGIGLMMTMFVMSGNKMAYVKNVL